MEKLAYKTQSFEGPLDLMLTLISKNKLDILDIKIEDLLNQYVEQINEMRNNKLEISSEFLQMAARLVYIKSESLLPKSNAETLKEELKEELLEYQQCKLLAEALSQKANFDLFTKLQSQIKIDMTYKNIHDSEVLQFAYLNSVGKSNSKLPPAKEAFSGIVETKIVSVSSRIVIILKNVFRHKKISYLSLFKKGHQKSELVATFLAVLELIKSNRIKIIDEDDDIKIVSNGDQLECST